MTTMTMTIFSAWLFYSLLPKDTLIHLEFFSSFFFSLFLTSASLRRVNMGLCSEQVRGGWSENDTWMNDYDGGYGSVAAQIPTYLGRKLPEQRYISVGSTMIDGVVQYS